MNNKLEIMWNEAEESEIRYDTDADMEIQRRSTRKLGRDVRYIQKRYLKNMGHAVAHLVQALRYKSEGRGSDFRRCLWNFSLT